MRLGDHCEKIGSGATPRGGKEAYLAAGPYSLIRSQNVYNDGFAHTGLAYISEAQAAALANVDVRPDDVLVNITGDSVARVCQVDAQVLPTRVNQHVAIVRPKKRTLDPTFLRYWFVTDETQNHLLALASAGATRPALTKAMLENLTVPAPHIDEQRAIAAVLSALDDKIELNRQMNETLEASARALFRDWFVDFGPTRAKAEGRPAYLAPDLWALFPDGLGDDGVPEGWEWGALNEMLVLQRGFDLPKGDRTDGAFPVIAASGPSGTHNEKRVSGPGVCTGRSGVLGGVYYVAEDFWPLNTSLWIKEYPNSTPLHAFHVLLDIDIGSFNAGSAVPTLNRNHIHNLPVVKPPMPAIIAFDEIASDLYARQNANLVESRTLAATRDALLPKLMSGELRVRDAEAQAA